jgi:chromate transporter
LDDSTFTPDDKRKLLRLLRLALWLGIAGFGGGFAVTQQTKRILVERERWMPEEDFLESFAVATALPGTSGTNLLTIIGVRLGGVPGGLLSATVFLLPSVLVMIAFGAIYDSLRNITSLATFLDGMSVATVGVVAGVAVDIGRSSLKRRVDWVLAAFAIVTLTLHALTLLEVIAVSGFCGAMLLRPHEPKDAPSDTPSRTGRFSFAAPFAAVTLSSIPLLLVVFARIGLATFGGGFAMVPAIEHEIVSSRHWLSESAFNDAIVLGQITPGPVAIAATFIGYRVAGFGGALSATVGMFGPPMVLSIVAVRSLRAFQTNPIVQGALHGVASAMPGIIAAAAVALWRTSVHGLPSIALALVAGGILIAKRAVPPLLVLASGGLVMLLLTYVR